MTSTKDEYQKTVSYIKKDIKDTQELLEETRETVGYYTKDFGLRKLYAGRIARYNNDIAKLEKALCKYKRELREFQNYSGVSQAFINSVEPATDEELHMDFIKDEKELQNPSKYDKLYIETQRQAIMDRAMLWTKLYNMEHGTTVI